jgi:hypothetical protein
MNQVEAAELGNAKGTLHAYIESLTDEEALDLIDDINNLLDDDTLSNEEREGARAGLAEVRRGEFITLDELDEKYG